MRIGTLLLLLLAPLPAAQIASTAPAAGVADQRAGRARAPIAISAAARGLDRVDGELWAVGATYKARFDRGGLMIVPPLGPGVPRSLPLWLSFDSADIGGRRLATADGSAEPEPGELEVRYRHGAALTECYEVRSDGLEQSFVFSELPAERGELVVRLRVATELIPREDGAGLFFEGAPGRGLHVGALTAIDAAGRRAPGQVRLAGDALELAVAADFVAEAELPLVLDPLFGGPLGVYASPGEVGDPDVDAGHHGWGYSVALIAFERRWSADDIDVYAQRLDTLTGSLLGSLVLLESSVSTRSMNPSVAYGGEDSVSGAFLVAWQQGSSVSGPFDVVGRFMSHLPDPPSGSAWITATFAIATAAASETDPDACLLGGAPPLGCGNVRFVVAYARDGIRARSFDVMPNCTTGGVHVVVPGPELTLSSIPSDARPITERYAEDVLVVWERFFSTPPPGDHDLFGGAIRSLSFDPYPVAVTATAEPLLTTIGPDETRVDVSELFGGKVGIAFERSPSSTSSDDDVYLMNLDVQPTSLGTILTPGSVLPVTVGAGDDDDVALAASFYEYEVWVAWVDHGSLGLGTVRAVGWYDQALYGLPSAALEPCEPPFEVAGSAIGVGFQDIELEGRLVDDADGLAVFESIGFGVYAQRLQSVELLADGVELADGCDGGEAWRTCPCAIGLNFTHALQAAEPNQPAFLIVGTEQAQIACASGCSLVPDPFTGFVIAVGITSSAGTATFPMPIPASSALQGLKFIDQWALVPGPSPCPALGATLSSAVAFTIQ